MKYSPAALFLTVCATGFAQQYVPFQGTITGGSGDRGKCTIDIVVDGVVEVEVSGINGRMRAVSGARPTWRRLQCNMPMPPNPAEFKFSPQEGRGRQRLLQDPGSNRGVTIVRIEDSDGGSEGYKFDLEWRGTTGGVISDGGFGGGGFGNNNGGGFGNGGNNNSGGGIFDGPGNKGKGKGGVQGWNQQIDFRGRGEGYFRNFRGSDDVLSDAVVQINRNGRVDVQLTTGPRERISLTGRLISVDRDRLVAEMAGGTIEGTMDIRIDNRNRVRELSMTGSGRNRFDLRWQQR